MKSDNNYNVTVSLSFSTWLHIAVAVLAVLKLTNQVDWSWFWIVAPWWGSLAVVFLAGFVSGLAEVRAKKQHKEAIARALGKRRNQ